MSASAKLLALLLTIAIVTLGNITLKLSGVLVMTWIVALSPLWVPVSIWLALMVVIVALCVLLSN